MKLKKSLTENELDPFVEEIFEMISPQTVVLLDGPLGAGKTFLISQLLQLFGVKKTSSPTYSLIHEYEGKQSQKIYHVDLYRLENDEDLESTGFWDLFENLDSFIFIEWSNKLTFSELPLGWKKIKIMIHNEGGNQREYEVETEP